MSILSRADLITEHEGKPLPKNLHIVEDTPQVRGLQAIIRFWLLFCNLNFNLLKVLNRKIVSFVILSFIRNRDATRDDFIFYSKRLMRILMEKTMSLLPYEVSHLVLCNVNELNICKTFF